MVVHFLCLCGVHRLILFWFSFNRKTSKLHFLIQIEYAQISNKAWVNLKPVSRGWQLYRLRYKIYSDLDVTCQDTFRSDPVRLFSCYASVSRIICSPQGRRFSKIWFQNQLDVANNHTTATIRCYWSRISDPILELPKCFKLMNLARLWTVFPTLTVSFSTSAKVVCMTQKCCLLILWQWLKIPRRWIESCLGK